MCGELSDLEHLHDHNHKYCGRQLSSYRKYFGAQPITLLVQRVERPGLDGLIEHEFSDQTIQAWSLNSLNQ